MTRTYTVSIGTGSIEMVGLAQSEYGRLGMAEVRKAVVAFVEKYNLQPATKDQNGKDVNLRATKYKGCKSAHFHAILNDTEIPTVEIKARGEGDDGVNALSKSIAKSIKAMGYATKSDLAKYATKDEVNKAIADHYNGTVVPTMKALIANAPTS